MDIEEHTDSEEEILVYAEFNDGVDVDKYRSIHVLGIDGKNPIIQADDSFFTGKFANSLGTYMFFDEDPNPQSADQLFDKLPEKSLKYLCKTNKLLNMEHAYVMPLASKEQIVKTEAEESKEASIKPVKFTSVEDALNKFKETLGPMTPNPEVVPMALTLATETQPQMIIPDTVLPDEAMDGMET